MRSVPPPASAEELWGWWGENPARRERRLAKGEALFRRGDPVDFMYRLESGGVRLERQTSDGRLLILHASKPGELVAEASLFGETYHCDAAATEPSVVSFCRRGALLAEMRADPVKALGFGRLIARQLQWVRHRLELRNVRSAAERVLLYLDLKADPATREVALEGPLQDLAAELGLTREAVYRAIAELEKRGRIKRQGRVISLLSST
jgi:CRP/FNR family transcriptional regulator, dissimilatory nitrate respiration regulator